MLEIDKNLLLKFKLSIGDFNGNELDDYYENQLKMAIADLNTDDISIDALNSELGQALVVLYAKALMNETDIATNPTISLLRNKLSLITKGDRQDVFN